MALDTGAASIGAQRTSRRSQRRFFIACAGRLGATQCLSFYNFSILSGSIALRLPFMVDLNTQLPEMIEKPGVRITLTLSEPLVGRLDELLERLEMRSRGALIERILHELFFDHEKPVDLPSIERQ
jgi:hypothetical protein